MMRISMAKNNLVTPSAYRRNATAQQNDAAAKKPRLVDIYELYAHKCKQAGVMDFDDILLNMNILLRDHPEALESIGGRFDYIMVDEYQDTNLAQYLILKKLGQRHNNICVVGDDSQSIYAFRGAKIENILNFKKDYPNHHIFRLEQNYRSTKVIVDAANSLIARNSNRIPKECYSMGEQGDKIKLIQAYTEHEEAKLVVRSIISKIASRHARYQDFAILYRTNNQYRVLEDELLTQRLPYVIYNGNSFYDAAIIKDWFAYMKLVINHNDDESFKRIANKPARGISDNTMSILIAAAQQLKIPIFKVVYEAQLETFGLKSTAIQKVKEFCDAIAKIHDNISFNPADVVVEQIDKAFGLYEYYKVQMLKEEKDLKFEDKVADLYNGVKHFVEQKKNEIREELLADGLEISENELLKENIPLLSLGAYLEDIALLSSSDVEDEDISNKITLMTIHSSKGLEFPHVYIVGLEENLFPSGGWLASESEIEEERRLFEDNKFYTPSKKAKFMYEEILKPPYDRSEEYPYILNTGRGTVGQWHTQTRTREIPDVEAIIPKEGYININTDLAEELGIKENDKVKVSSPNGITNTFLVKLSRSVKKGDLYAPMHYIEANSVLTSVFDTYSKEPNYKYVPVNIEKINGDSYEEN